MNLRPVTFVDSRWRRVGAATTKALSYGFRDYSAIERRSFFQTHGRYADVEMEVVAARTLNLTRETLIALGGEGVIKKVAIDAGAEAKGADVVTAKYIQIHVTPEEALKLLNSEGNKSVRDWLLTQGDDARVVLDNIVVLEKSVDTTNDLKLGAEVKWSGNGLQAKSTNGSWRNVTETQPLVYGYKMYSITWQGDMILAFRVDDPDTSKR